MDCGSLAPRSFSEVGLLPLSLVSLLTNPALTPQQAVATERQQAAAVHGPQARPR
jgi:hypothetical protein